MLPTISVSFHLSDSSEQRAQYQRKLANVQYLVQQYTMTAILETHVTGAKAEHSFCRSVEGTRRFFTHCMAVIVQESWADHFNPVLVTVVDGVIVAQATQWAKEDVSNADIVFFAGDRNFVRSDSERWSGASSV